MDDLVSVRTSLAAMAANTERWRVRAAQTSSEHEREVFLELADRYDSLIERLQQETQAY